MKYRRFLYLAILLACCASSLGAQTNTAGMVSATSMERTTSNYYFAKPNELTIIVNVLGYVQRPGRYEISSSIDLVNLMSLAGGATPDGTLSDVKITRVSEIDGRVRMREIHLNLDEVAKLTPNELRLLPGDVIQIDRNGWAGFKDVFTVIVGAAVIVTAISYVVIAKKQ